MKPLTQKQIRDTIRGLGYSISFVGGTSIIENFVSTVDGSKKPYEVAWSSRDNDWDFLRDVIGDKNLKGL